MTTTITKNPRAGRRGGSGNADALGESDRRRQPTGTRRVVQAPRLPRNWRAHLPDPETYYRTRVAKLGARHSNGWAQGRCPFHDDRNASLSVHLDGERGHWRCFTGCGRGDLVSFHMRLIERPFVEAVRDLVGGSYDRRT